MFLSKCIISSDENVIVITSAHGNTITIVIF